MNGAALGRAIRDAGKSFLAAKLGELYEKRKELETPQGCDKIAQAYFKKQVGHYDQNIDQRADNDSKDNNRRRYDTGVP